MLVQGMHLMSPVRVAMVRVSEPNGNTSVTRTVAVCFLKELRVIDAVPGRHAAARVYRVQLLVVSGTKEKNLAVWGPDEARVNHPEMGKMYIAYNCVMKPGE